MRAFIKVAVATVITVLSSQASLAGGLGKQVNEAVVEFYVVVDPLQYPGGESRLPNGHVGETLTVGDAIQGGFYGNAANTDGTNNGHGTLPSLAPGPAVCDPDCDTVVPGTTWGEVKREFNPAALGLAH